MKVYATGTPCPLEPPRSEDFQLTQGEGDVRRDFLESPRTSPAAAQRELKPPSGPRTDPSAMSLELDLLDWEPLELEFLADDPGCDCPLPVWNDTTTYADIDAGADAHAGAEGSDWRVAMRRAVVHARFRHQEPARSIATRLSLPYPLVCVWLQEHHESRIPKQGHYAAQSRYSASFKQEIVDLCWATGKPDQVARERGVARTRVYAWFREARIAQGGPVPRTRRKGRGGPAVAESRPRGAADAAPSTSGREA